MKNIRQVIMEDCSQDNEPNNDPHHHQPPPARNGDGNGKGDGKTAESDEEEESNDAYKVRRATVGEVSGSVAYQVSLLFFLLKVKLKLFIVT